MQLGWAAGEGTSSTHRDHVSIELLRHQVAKVDAHSLTEQEGAIISNVHTCV